ncbi:hypothetical protein RFI_19047, partial [Reticulomyxa filosa]
FFIFKKKKKNGMCGGCNIFDKAKRLTGKSSEQMSKWTISVVLMCFLFGLGYIFSSSVTYTVAFVEDTLSCNINYRFLLFVLQRALLHGYFIERLRLVFRGSIYGYSPWFFRVCYVVLCLAVVSSSVWYFYLVSKNCYDSVTVALGTLLAVCWDAAIGLCVCGCFVYKLKQVMQLVHACNDTDFSDGRSQKNSLKMQQVIYRLTVLACTGVLVSFFAVSLYAFVGTPAAVMEIFFNSFLLSLSFKAYNKWFHFWCAPCLILCPPK